MRFIKVDSPEPVVDHVFESINKRLSSEQKVLWLLSGGSSIAYQVEVAQRLSTHDLSNLTAILTDERYGPVGHPDSNHQKLLDAGFKLPGASFVPILTGKSFDETTQDFADFIEPQLKSAAYKIVCIGIGADGHFLGILGHSPAVDSKETVIAYQGADFPRITMGLSTLDSIDEAVAYMFGKEKHKVISDLVSRQLDLAQQPSQALKTLKQVTIYNDYKGDKP